MERLLGDHLIIIYFIVGLSVINYDNFHVPQKVMLIYAITYAACLLNIMDTKWALVTATILLFIYFEYLTDDHYKLKLVKRIHYKLLDAGFLLFFQYYYGEFLAALLMQTRLVRGLSIFFTSLKDHFVANYYQNRQHYKEYLLWLYFRVVKTRINGTAVQPVSRAFTSPDMEEWSREGIFVACMGLSNKDPGYYSMEPYSSIMTEVGADVALAESLYWSFSGGNLI